MSARRNQLDKVAGETPKSATILFLDPLLFRATFTTSRRNSSGNAHANILSGTASGIHMLDVTKPCTTPAPSDESLGHERLLFFEADLSNISQIESLPVAEWMQANSTVATTITVINNVSSRHQDHPLEENVETWNEAIATSLSGAFFLAQNAIKAAVGLRASVKILNISSILSSLVGKQAASYGVAKAGLEYLTKYFAVIGRELPIPLKSLGVAPGMIVQNRHMKKYLASENTDFREANERAQPGKPYATESDLADLVLWLTQDSPD